MGSNMQCVVLEFLYILEIAPLQRYPPMVTSRIYMDLDG